MQFYQRAVSAWLLPSNRRRKQVALLCGALLFAICCGVHQGYGAEAQPSVSAAPEASGLSRVPAYFLRTFPYHLVEGFKESFLRLDHLSWLALAGGTAAGLQGPDDDIQTYFRDERPFEVGKEVGNTLGMLGVLFGISGLTFGVGEITQTSSLSATGVMMFEALAITAPVTTLFKIGVRRERPDDSNNLSFPSMHAAGSFALATVTMRQYGLLAGLPAYLTATWIAMARMQKDKHFLSDTLFGAVLGTVIGNAVVNVHQREKAAAVTVLPVVSLDVLGLLVAGRF